MPRRPQTQEEPSIKRWTGEFADPATERAFRMEQYARLRGQNRVIGIILATIYVTYIASDFWLLGWTAKFAELATLRVTMALLILGLMVPYVRPENHIRAEYRVLTVQLLVPFTYFYIATQMPLSHIIERGSLPSVMAMMIVVAQYVFFSNRLNYSAAAAAVTTISYLAISFGIARLSGSALAMEALLHLIAHVGGFAVAYRGAIGSRRQFLLLNDQRRLNRALEERRAELERARDEALHATRAKSEFLAHMSHELRTPLNAIIGFADLMRRELFGRIGVPRYREYAEDIHNSGTHLLAVINDVLDLSKTEAGKAELQETVVDVAATVEAARRLVAVRAESAGIALATEDVRAMPPLRADERMLKQMLLNLLTNAIKFTPRGGSVAIGTARSRDGAVHVWVTDTGAGLSQEEIPRILEPYGRSDVARIQNAEGTGLGLPLVKAMIEAHGGRLDIVSAKGEGSTFTLRFPPERRIERAQAA